MNVIAKLGILTTFLVTSAFHLTRMCRGNMSHKLHLELPQCSLAMQSTVLT